MTENHGIRKTKLIGTTAPDVNAPLISVIITAFDRHEYLKQAVDSVLNQHLSRDMYEVIVSKNFVSEFDKEWSSKGVKLLLYKDRGSGTGGSCTHAL